jgi:hypothetical protein
MKQKTLIIIALVAIVAIVLGVVFYTSKNTKTSARFKATTTSPTCLLPADRTTVTNAQTTVNTLVSTVSAMKPAPTADVLATFNTAITGINSQITALLALPTCCSGTNQQYNASTGLCVCASPYGLDSTGGCTISCTSPQAVYSGGKCVCNSGYTLLSDNKTCDNVSNDTITTTYIPQIATLLTSIKALPKSISTASTPSVAGRYISVSKTSGYLEIAELIAYDPSGNKIIPVTATSSTPYVDTTGTYSASLAIDGNTNTVFATGSGVAGTAGSLYLTVDYGTTVYISKISIISRVDCCKNMIVGAVVKILDAGSNVVFTANPLPSSTAPTSTTTPESTVYADTLSNLAFGEYDITIPATLPVGK